MKISRTAVVVCLLAAMACGRSEKPSPEEISDTLKEKGTTDVLQAAAGDKYDAPADGKLTDAQVQMYLKVREREKEIARVARQEAQAHAKKADAAGEKSLGGMMEAFKTLGSVADMAIADIRAAQELGLNTAEYQWVKSTILSVSTTDMSAQMMNASSAAIDSGYAQIKKQHDEAKDETTKKALAGMMAQYEKSKDDIEKQKGEIRNDAAFEYNKQLMSKYEGTLNAMTSEIAKYYDTDEEAKKNMAEVEKAVATAGASAATK